MDSIVEEEVEECAAVPFDVDSAVAVVDFDCFATFPVIFGGTKASGFSLSSTLVETLVGAGCRSNFAFLGTGAGAGGERALDVATLEPLVSVWVNCVRTTCLLVVSKDLKIKDK